MDFGKSGNPKMSKDRGRQTDPNLKSGKVVAPKGSTKITNPRPSKEDVLARMKEQAAKARE